MYDSSSDKLEKATECAERILNGDIEAGTKLQLMQILEGNGKTPGLFEQAGINEDEGFIVIGVSREELYLIIAEEALDAVNSGHNNLRIAKMAYEKATDKPIEDINPDKVPEMLDHIKHLLTAEETLRRQRYNLGYNHPANTPDL